MAKISFTTLTLGKRLDLGTRFTEAEIKAALKTLQGSVNRAVKRVNETFGGDTYATKAIKKAGLIKSYTDLKNEAYTVKMDEIRRGMKYLSYTTLRVSDFKRYVKTVADRLNTNIGVNYDELSKDEQNQYWEDYYKVLQSPGVLARKLTSDEIQKEVFTLKYGNGTANALDAQAIISRMVSKYTPPPVPPKGVTFRAEDLLGLI